MRLLRRVVTAMLLVSIIVVSVGLRLGSLALGWSSRSSGPSSPETNPSAYGAPGAHGVGLRPVSIGDPPSMDGMLWYPSANARTGSVRYVYGLKALSAAPFALATYPGVGTRDATADVEDGPFPLVILSPGFAFGVGAYAWLAEHLASHGFAVLAMEHAEELDPLALWQATIQRPRDTLTALGAAGQEVRGGGWAQLVDLSRVAVVGHSYGGYTALAAAGARLDTTRMREICDDADPDDPIRFQCNALGPRTDDMAAAAGLSPTPVGLWPSWGDDRVDAVVALAGDAVMFGEAGLAEIEVPVMTIGGTADVDAPYAWGTRLAYQAASSQRKVEIGLEGAEHLVFTGACDVSRRVLIVLAEPFCADAAWEKTTAHAYVRHYVTAFLLAELQRDRAAAGALGADAGALPRTHYAATGY